MDAIHTLTTTGPLITFDCPACQEQNVEAATRETVESYRMLYVIPLFTLRNTFVVCQKCQAEFLSQMRLVQLVEATPEVVSQQLSRRQSFIGQFCAVACILLCWVPGAGLILAIIAWLLNRKTGGWPLLLAKIGVVLGFVAPVVLFGGLILMEELSRKK